MYTPRPKYSYALYQKFFLDFLLGNSEDALLPKVVNGLKGIHVIHVACGSGDAQTLAVTKDGEDNNEI